ncbi:hypothetical protein B5M09_006717, partial [Aphanomyces astaci]
AFGYRKNFALFVDDLVSGGGLTSDAAQRVLTEYNASAFVLGTAPHIQPYKLGLLCSGTPESQWEKIHTLGVAWCFDHVLIVPAGNLSGDGNLSKVLKNMAKQLAVPTSKVVLVGKRVFGELKAAKQMGLITVRMMSNLDQLPAILVLAEGRRPRPHIVALGGGTGLAVLLKALREYPADLTAIVTVFDSGRHSGALRKTLGILPPGDIRNCLVALSDSGWLRFILYNNQLHDDDDYVLDQLLHQLMNYRFQDHYLEGASLGNLLLAALTDIHGGSFDQAVASISDILNIRGQVLPATLDQSELCAVLADGSTVVSEVNVRSPDKAAPIRHVFLENASVTAYPAAIAAIEAADIILISPGGFYTSIIATLLARGAVVYISNVATQTGQSDGYTLPQTLSILAEYLGDDVVDYVIANNAIPSTLPFEHGETLLLPTRDMEAAERPILVQGRAFTDMSAFDVEWKKVPMIKHNGEMVLSMLYRIIEKEMEGSMAVRTKTQYSQELFDEHTEFGATQ